MSITKIQGFLANGLAAGIKKNGAADFALIYSPVKCQAAAVYTTNKVQAAPIKITKESLQNHTLQGVIINSGNANACNGERGYADALEMRQLVAEELRIKATDVAVASTGVIGLPMPMEKVRSAVAPLVCGLSNAGGKKAAEAIMTTDTAAKVVYLEKEIAGRKVAIGGMAKGSGMIHPNMATMLAFLTTDVNIKPKLLQVALKKAVNLSFNMLSVDGDTSTNDMALLLANGMAGNALIAEEGKDFENFCDLVREACIRLAKMMAKDGEGASKLLEVQVIHGQSFADAKSAAMAVIKSSLVKTALFGEDANWGRIIAAVGYSGCKFNPELTDIWLASPAGEIQTAAKGCSVAFDEAKASKILAADEVIFKIDLHAGEENATAWGCDLSYDYVKINGSYRS